jgi:FtsZ-binding cell division protein ZapB
MSTPSLTAPIQSQTDTLQMSDLLELPEQNNQYIAQQEQAIAEREEALADHEHIIEDHKHIIEKQQKLLKLMEEKLRLARQKRFGAVVKNHPFKVISSMRRNWKSHLAMWRINSRSCSNSPANSMRSKYPSVR